MRVIKLFTILALSSLFLIGCGGVDPQEVVGVDNEPTVEETVYGNDQGVWARDNLDLLALGNVLKESDNIQGFERRINSDDRFNNLDLNGDGYVDYISVEEFEDRDDNQRGFSLFSKFDGNNIQEIASIIFGRDRIDQPGSRVYIRGNEQIYGDNYGYEGNWLDKSIGIAQYVFSDRDDYYRSPYYDDNYPDYYDEYRVVETPVYRERITKYMVNPAMTKITTPTMKIKIKSPYPGRSYNRIYAKMAKPTKEQIDFYKNKPSKPDFVKNGKDKDKGDKDSKKSGKADKDFDKTGKIQNEDKKDRGNDDLWEGKIEKNKGKNTDNPSSDKKSKNNDKKPEKAGKNNGGKEKNKNDGKGKDKDGKGKN